VRSSIARRLGIDIGALAPVDREVEGVVEMILDATQRFDAPLTAERLFGWRAALFPTGRSGLTRISTGRWRDDRTGPMQVVSGPIGRERVHFQAPAATNLARETRAFLAWFEAPEAIDPVVVAGDRQVLAGHGLARYRRSRRSRRSRARVGRRPEHELRARPAPRVIARRHVPGQSFSARSIACLKPASG
jgi:hypothetical protein